MNVKKFAELKDHEEICRMIQRFCDEQRETIHTRKRAKSKNADGAVPDNPFGAGRSKAGLRQSVVSRGEIVIDKQLSQDFMLIIKHPAAFTAVLEGLAKHFPVYAVIRNPLATLASWNSIDVNVQSGSAPAAERLDRNLAAQLAAIDDNLDRQIYLLGWFHGQFRRYLPERSIIRYESVIESGGSGLSVVRPEAANLSEPLELRNMSKLYDYQSMLRIGERLLNSEGAYWESYTKESVEYLLDELRTVKRQRRSPVFRFDKAFGVVRSAKSLFKPEGGTETDIERHRARAATPKNAQRRRISDQRKKIRSKRQELSQINKELDTAKGGAERTERVKRAKEKKEEIRQLKNELRAVRARAEDITDGRTDGSADGG